MDQGDGNEVHLSVALSAALKFASSQLSQFCSSDYKLQYKTKSQIMHSLYTISVLMGRLLVLFRSRNILAQTEKVVNSELINNSTLTVQKLKELAKQLEKMRPKSRFPKKFKMFSDFSTRSNSISRNISQIDIYSIFHYKLPKRIKHVFVHKNKIIINALPLYQCCLKINEDSFCSLKLLRLNYPLLPMNLKREEILMDFIKSFTPFHIHEAKALYILDSKIFNFMQMTRYLLISFLVSKISSSYQCTTICSNGITKIKFPESEYFFSDFRLILVNGSVYFTSSAPVCEIPENIPYSETITQMMTRFNKSMILPGKKIYIKEIANEEDIHLILSEARQIVHFTAMTNLFGTIIISLLNIISTYPHCSLVMPNSHVSSTYISVGSHVLDGVRIYLNYFSGNIEVFMPNGTKQTLGSDIEIGNYVTKLRIWLIEDICFNSRPNSFNYNSSFYAKGIFTFRFSFAPNNHVLIYNLQNNKRPIVSISNGETSTMITPLLFTNRRNFSQNTSKVVLNGKIYLLLIEFQQQLKELGYQATIYNNALKVWLMPAHYMQFKINHSMHWSMKIVPTNDLPKNWNCIQIIGNFTSCRFIERLIFLIQMFLDYSNISDHFGDLESLSTPDTIKFRPLSHTQSRLDLNFLDCSIFFGISSPNPPAPFINSLTLHNLPEHDFIVSNLFVNLPTIVSNLTFSDKLLSSTSALSFIKGTLPIVLQIFRDFAHEKNWNILVDDTYNLFLVFMKKLTVKIRINQYGVLHGSVAHSGFSTFALKPLETCRVQIRQKFSSYNFIMTLDHLKHFHELVNKVTVLFGFCVSHNISEFDLKGPEFNGTTPDSSLMIKISNSISIVIPNIPVITEFSANFANYVNSTKLQLIMCEILIRITARTYLQSFITFMGLFLTDDMNWPIILKSLRISQDFVTLSLINSSQEQINLQIATDRIALANSDKWFAQRTILKTITSSQYKIRSLIEFFYNR